VSDSFVAQCECAGDWGVPLAPWEVHESAEMLEGQSKVGNAMDAYARPLIGAPLTMLCPHTTLRFDLTWVGP
jgi:hypothetical protein